MGLSFTTDAIAISVDDASDQGFEQFSTKHSYPYLRSPSHRQMMRQVISSRPRVVIVKVLQLKDCALQLIRILQNDWCRVAVIVVAADQDNDFEREARLAGATCFLPDDEYLGHIDSYVESIIDSGHHSRAKHTGSTKSR
jgi:DNA-binding NarL/FixJ family response regulator